MPGVRLDRFVVSSAIALLMSAVGGTALAEPPSKTAAAQDAPTATIVTMSPGDSSATAPAAPTGKKDSATSTPAEAQATPNKPAPATAVTIAPAAAATSSAATAASSRPVTGAAPQARPPSAAHESSGGPPAPAATAAAPALNSAGRAGTPAATAPATAGATSGARAKAQPAVAADKESKPSAVATPAAPVDVDAAVAEQLRKLAEGKFDHIIGSKKERVIIDAFYSGRNYAPLWITGGKANARATAAISYLGHVAADGLDPSDYPAPDFAALKDPAALAQAEIRLSTSVITYAHHAAIGRVHWSRVSGDIYYDRKAPDPADVLARMAEAKDVGAALDAYEPHYAAYLALKQKLKEIRAGKLNAVEARIANGPALKVGMVDARVPELRKRLSVPGDGTAYDRTLAEAVRKFQRAHDLRATGMLNRPTVEALNGRMPADPEDTVIANMERWRWMPHELGKNFVIVNLPDFSLRLIDGGKALWRTKIVIGKPATPTPMMSAEMKFITVNPTWNVPPSIAAREYLPALRQDPTVLARMGLKVSTNPDGTIHIYQPPGERNALGRVRFNFPNKFLVYQHDTPDKYLFAYDRRAFSHGCMRVQDPVKYAEVLLSVERPHEGYTQERIRDMFGNSEINIQFPKFLPVHITYQTAFVGAAGNLEFRDDIYGRDREILAILHGKDRNVADIPIVRKENRVSRELLAMPEPSPFWGGQSPFWGSHSIFGGGPSFFTRLFGPPPRPPMPVRHRAVSRHRRTAERRMELH